MLIDVKKLQEMSTENKVLYWGTELRDMEPTIFFFSIEGRADRTAKSW